MGNLDRMRKIMNLRVGDSVKMYGYDIKKDEDGYRVFTLCPRTGFSTDVKFCTDIVDVILTIE